MSLRMFAAVALTGAFLAQADRADAITLGPDFTADYTVTDLGSVTGLPANYGGLTFKYDDPNTLLIGGAANGPNGRIYAVTVVRDPVTQEVTGFSGSATALGTVGAYNDGGVTYGPNNVLFTSGWPTNTLGQTLPGETSEVSITNLSTLGVASSGSAVGFVPAGFDGAGNMKIVSYSGGQWYDITYTQNIDGSLNLVSATHVDLDPVAAGIQNLPGGPEGFVYIDGVNVAFNGNSMLVAEYQAGRIAAYEVDANGNPILSTRRDFITGLTGAEGAAIDPLTGDFFFSTFGGGNRVVRVSGFVTPPNGGGDNGGGDNGGGDPGTPPTAVIPLPAAGWLLLTALGGLAITRRRRG